MLLSSAKAALETPRASVTSAASRAGECECLRAMLSSFVGWRSNAIAYRARPGTRACYSSWNNEGGDRVVAAGLPRNGAKHAGAPERTTQRRDGVRAAGDKKHAIACARVARRICR